MLGEILLHVLLMALFYLHKEALILLQGLRKKWLMPSLQMLISMCQVSVGDLRIIDGM
jgi:hypothetical protein